MPGGNWLEEADKWMEKPENIGAAVSPESVHTSRLL